MALDGALGALNVAGEGGAEMTRDEMQAAEEMVQRAISRHNAQQWYGDECVIRMAAENHPVVVTTPCCGGFLYVEPHPPRH